ncbi:MAG: rhodanese [Nitrospirae bacterium]|nr:rhodanese [Candidatus Manganitrophaceae bacterium]
MESNVSDDQISPLALKQKLADGENILVLDVREPMEYQTAKIEGSILIPLGELAGRVDELDPNQEIITLCHHGMRSQAGLGILVSQGFSAVKNLSGGIDAYSQVADPSIPRYR